MNMELGLLYTDSDTGPVDIKEYEKIEEKEIISNGTWKTKWKVDFTEKNNHR